MMSRTLLAGALALIVLLGACRSDPPPLTLEAGVPILPASAQVSDSRAAVLAEGLRVTERRLVVVFEAGSCDAVSRAEVRETADAVRVAVDIGFAPERAQGEDGSGGLVCDSAAHRSGYVVELRADLGGRRLLDDSTGEVVPVSGFG